MVPVSRPIVALALASACVSAQSTDRPHRPAPAAEAGEDRDRAPSVSPTPSECVETEYVEPGSSHEVHTTQVHQKKLARKQTIESGSGLAVACAADDVALHPDGTLAACELAATITIGDRTCRRGHGIALHTHGELAGCTVDEPVEAMGAVFAQGSSLSFHPNGVLAGAALDGPTYIAGWLVQSEIEMDERGRITHLVLAEKRTVAGIALPERARVWLHADGSAWHLEYVADEGFLPHGAEWRDTRHVTFDCPGRIVSDETEHWQGEPEPPG